MRQRIIRSANTLLLQRSRLGGNGHETGQTLAEYALTLALIAVLCIGALVALRGGVTGTLGSVTAKL
jgi:Flp pilus assembly pilin Flp